MFPSKTLAFAYSAATVLAIPSPSYQDTKSVQRRYVTPSSQGTNNGFFYSMWSDSTGDVEYNNGNAGEYSLTWSNAGDVVVGKGFNPGAPRNITYTADYEPNGISFLSVYGWFTNPLTEYYICENWGTGNPSGGDGMIHVGTLQSDGSTYEVYKHQQVNAPSIQGTTNFMQYWSIRTDNRSSGTINTANHYNYWKSIGLPIGSFDYQILATEGVKSSGKSDVTISEGGSDAGASSAPAPAPAPSSTSAIAAAAPSSSSVQPASSIYSAPASPSAAPVASSSTLALSSATVVATTLVSSASYGDFSSSVAPSVAPVASVTSSIVADTPSISYSSPASSAGAIGASTAAGSFPSFGGFTPSAGFQTPGAGGHYTPGATPTPYFGHHGHHSHRPNHWHFSDRAYQSGFPSAAGIYGAVGAPSSPVSAAAVSESSDC